MWKAAHGIGGSLYATEQWLHWPAVCACGVAPCVVLTWPCGAPWAFAGTEGAAVLDFTATWCGPCKMIAPVYEQLAASNSSIAFYKINIDNADVENAVNSAMITAVPTFVAYRGTERIASFTGADRVQLAQLVSQVAAGEAAGEAAE